MFYLLGNQFFKNINLVGGGEEGRGEQNPLEVNTHLLTHPAGLYVDKSP